MNMLKTFDDFKKIITYLTTVGFKDKKEMEKYLKSQGFGVKYHNLYTDSEKNPYMFKVTFHGDSVYKMEVINILPIETLKSFGFVAFA